MKRSVLALIVLLMFGCAGPRPRIPAQAAISAASQWRDQHGVMDSISQNWWQSFRDPVLNSLIETALVQNDDLAIAASRVAQARADYRLARSSILPALDAAALGAHERDVSAFGDPEQQSIAGARLELKYDFDFSGRRRRLNEAAQAQLLQSIAANAGVRLSLVATVTQGYVNLRALDGILVLARETLKVREQSLKLARRRVETGYAPTLDLHQAEAEYEATRRLVPAATLAVIKQENGLAVLLGEAPYSIARGGVLGALATPKLAGYLPSALLSRRPDVIAAEEAVVAADRSLDAARAAFMPDLSLDTSTGGAFSTLIGNPIAIWSVGGSALAPLFAGGRLRAQQDAAAARRDEAAFAYRRAVLRAFQDVEDALANEIQLHEQVDALEAECRSLEQAARIATSRYRAGYSPYLEQLDAERSLLSAQVALIEMRASYLISYVELFRAMGGGWSTSNLR